MAEWLFECSDVVVEVESRLTESRVVDLLRRCSVEKLCARYMIHTQLRQICNGRYAVLKQAHIWR